MLKKTKIALAAALILGAASAAMAGDQGEERGGFLIPGSSDGVNPVYHPDIFVNAGNGGKAYGYVASPHQPQRASHERRQDR